MASLRQLSGHLSPSGNVFQDRIPKPAIKAEMTQLKARAEQVQRQECIEQAKRSKPFPWCEKYLKP